MKTYIYLITNLQDNKIYVGKTTRLTQREYTHRRNLGSQIEFTVIDEIDSIHKKDWKPLECFWISQFKVWGFDLANKNEGGGGGPTGVKKPGAGHKKGTPSTFLGKTHTEIAIEKNRIAHLGNINRKGKKNSPEHIANYKIARTGVPLSKVECPYCSKVGAGGSMRQWHFNNCTHKPGNENLIRTSPRKGIKDKTKRKR